MTRSHKANDPPHGASEDLLASRDALPRNFGKHAAHVEVPNKAKKNGGGKANWGRDGDEVIDEPEFNFNNARRRSNSESHGGYIRSKFEVSDEPVFDEALAEQMSRAADAHVDVETASNDSQASDKI
jgi:hypothetical protein